MACTWLTVYGLSQALPVIAEGKPALSLQSLQVDDVIRSYYLHLPESVDTPVSWPVVLVLHGGGRADGDETAARTGYLQLADQHNFIAVYPNGIESQWNDGRGKTFRRDSSNTDSDDVGFISRLIDHLITDYAADPDRIYVTGLSNGGMMTLRLGCDLDEKLAAIAPVIANMPMNISTGCDPEGPLPMLLMNGTDDPLVPWNGGMVKVFRKSLGKVLSTQATLQFWADHNGCLGEPLIEALPDRDTADGSTVHVHRYPESDLPCNVLLYRIDGGGHTFPGSPGRNLPRLLGNRNADINAAGVIWGFFEPLTNTTTKTAP